MRGARVESSHVKQRSCQRIDGSYAARKSCEMLGPEHPEWAGKILEALHDAATQAGGGSDLHGGQLLRLCDPLTQQQGSFLLMLKPLHLLPYEGFYPLKLLHIIPAPDQQYVRTPNLEPCTMLASVQSRAMQKHFRAPGHTTVLHTMWPN